MDVSILATIGFTVAATLGVVFIAFTAGKKK